MLTTAITAALAISAILTCWLLVQLAWRRAFPDSAPDEDVLAGRLGCHQCPCTSPCETRECERKAGTPQEPEHSEI